MKKSVIVLIGLIYVASIVFIGFFGMKITAYNATVYATSLSCINEDVRVSANNIKSIVFDYKENAPAEENVYLLVWRVYPENTTNKSVKFVYDNTNTVASIDSAGRIWIKKTGVLTFQIVSNSNETINETITLLVV